MDKKMWGGRFKKEIDKDFFEFQKSINYDHKLAEYDVYHSLIHVGALAAAEILSKDEEDALVGALREILSQIKKGKFKFDPECEDIHSDIQNKVKEKAGKAALKLHTLRSRNDQVVFDEKMYVLTQYIETIKLLSNLLEEIFKKSQDYEKRYFIGYTHTQRAQVVYFSDYILAYGQMLMRDYDRLVKFEEGLKIHIGAGALAGSPLSPDYYRRAISISGVIRKHFGELSSPMDHVSSRDFVIEFLSILAIIQMHLSRMSEDMIMYSTREFDYLDLPEEFCTGSSLMPHKKNADFLELVRGSTGKVYGSLFSVLTTMKGLPLAYNRDMQLDKEPLFASVETVKDELTIMAKFIKKLKLKKDNIDNALKDEHLYATEIAEFLVMKKGVAFKDAHDIVGKLIRHSEEKKVKIQNISDKLLSTFHKDLNKKILTKVMNPKYAVLSKKTAKSKIPKLKLH
ncbi:MAG: argininosuccinate lyase [Candidatus Omnitrophica bacterium]|nr:argininosuccinate lyase [Candidatus Omnitrophota bacterium]